MINRINFCFFVVFGSGGLCSQSGPEWWQEEVLVLGSIPKNHAAANVGQAKHLVVASLAELAKSRPDVAANIEAELVPAILSEGLEVPPNAQLDWYEKQRAPLLSGQLKALSKPFFDRLQEVDSAWLSLQKQNFGTTVTGSIYPWTNQVEDDSHYSIANLGQLKACFALDFPSLPFIDSDGDGLPDDYELANGLDPANSQDGNLDSDGDGVSNFSEYLLGGELQVPGGFSVFLSSLLGDASGDLIDDSFEIFFEQSESEVIQIFDAAANVDSVSCVIAIPGEGFFAVSSSDKTLKRF